MEGMLRETETTAQALRLKLELVPAHSPSELAGAFAAMAQMRVDAFVQLPSPMLFAEHKRIVELADKYRLPAMYAAREFVEDGGLMCYGASQPDLFRRAAMLVVRILKGANPAELPVEQPSTFDFSINLRAAKALDLIMPASLLVQATEVIE